MRKTSVIFFSLFFFVIVITYYFDIFFSFLFFRKERKCPGREQRKMASSVRTLKNQNENENNNSNKKKSFKSVGWYFTIGNYFASTIKQKRIFHSAFEDILSAHEGLAENLFADEPSLTASDKDSAHQRPPISDEMRSIVHDLNQFHLFE